MPNHDGFWDFAGFWEFFNPFNEDKDKEGPESFICPVCDKEFDDTYEIEIIDKNRGIFKCPVCGKKLQFDETLKTIIPIKDFPRKDIAPSQKFVVCNTIFHSGLITTELQGETKEEILAEMASMFTAAGIIKDRHEFLNALRETEAAMGSTALGEGFAFPYGYTEFNEGIAEKIALGMAISRQGVDFNSFDEQPTHVVIMTAYLSSKPEGLHVKFLAKVSGFIKAHPELKKIFLEAGSKEEIFAYLRENFESKSV